MQNFERRGGSRGEEAAQNAAEGFEATLPESGEGTAEQPSFLRPEEEESSRAAARHREIAELTQSIESTKQQLDATRERLELPPTDEEPPSVTLQKEQLQQLQQAQEAGHEGEEKEEEEEEKEIISEEEKERIIQEEKEKLLQEKMAALFQEFSALPSKSFEHLLATGSIEGAPMHSAALGTIEPRVAQPLAQSFREGKESIKDIQEIVPDLLQVFDAQLEEAKARADQRIRELIEQRLKELPRTRNTPYEKIESSEREKEQEEQKGGDTTPASESPTQEESAQDARPAG
ncbi:hypothetical protein D6833_14020 [Candidatus Parcubacteria bacterium]|nr:MAG: hypothetical protein D6833_14020 [Candidatus Parcubacteria bacterium]